MLRKLPAVVLPQKPIKAEANVESSGTADTTSFDTQSDVDVHTPLNAAGVGTTSSRRHRQNTDSSQSASVRTAENPTRRQITAAAAATARKQLVSVD